MSDIEICVLLAEYFLAYAELAVLTTRLVAKYDDAATSSKWTEQEREEYENGRDKIVQTILKVPLGKIKLVESASSILCALCDGEMPS